MDLIKILFQKAQSLDSIDKLDNVVEIVGKMLNIISLKRKLNH